MRALLLLLLAAAPVLSGCDLIAALIISPFFPGKPLPPPDDLECPLALAPAEDAPLPASFTPALPDVRPGCDVGTKTLHRLNRYELDNTIRDLTGLDLQLAAQSFPVDDFGGGFDNNADVLAMSPLLVEKLESAAGEVVRQAMQRPGEISAIYTFEAENGLGTGFRPSDQSPDYAFGPGNDVDVQAVLPNAAGSYAVRIRVGAQKTTDAHVELLVDGAVVLASAVTGTADNMQLLEATVNVAKGPVHHVGARYPFTKKAKGELLVDFFELEGPLTVTELGPDPLARQRIVTCDLAAGLPCARTIVEAFARRAWRRPAAVEELDKLEGFMLSEMRQGDALEDALRTALTAVLLSPHFLFRVEQDPVPAAHALDDHELAARLSYFVWSSMPDDRLLALADQGALQDPAVLEGETRRMLQDPKSRSLVDSFAGQWLFTRAVQSASPDPLRFPQFDEGLRAAMQCETELTFDRLLRDDTLDARDLVTGDTTFVNDRLAAHYGLEPPVKTLDHGWGLVSTQGTGRAGVLTNASLLTVTSQPTRTSPTKRGKWVLENLLCEAPNPPPPGVEGLPEPPPGQEQESVRDRMEQHRADPFCASCHAVIDPIGFGLEHFDAIGRWRASDAGFAIDDSALYMDDPQASFHGARELAQLVHDDPQLPFCMAEKTMTYALGKGMDDAICNIEGVRDQFAAGGYKLSDLIVQVVQSPAFRMRRPEP